MVLHTVVLALAVVKSDWWGMHHDAHLTAHKPAHAAAHAPKASFWSTATHAKAPAAHKKAAPHTARAAQIGAPDMSALAGCTSANDALQKVINKAAQAASDMSAIQARINKKQNEGNAANTTLKSLTSQLGTAKTSAVQTISGLGAKIENIAISSAEMETTLKGIMTSFETSLATFKEHAGKVNDANNALATYDDYLKAHEAALEKASRDAESLQTQQKTAQSSQSAACGGGGGVPLPALPALPYLPASTPALPAVGAAPLPAATPAAVAMPSPAPVFSAKKRAAAAKALKKH